MIIFINDNYYICRNSLCSYLTAAPNGHAIPCLCIFKHLHNSFTWCKASETYPEAYVCSTLSRYVLLQPIPNCHKNAPFESNTIAFSPPSVHRLAHQAQRQIELMPMFTSLTSDGNENEWKH